METFSPAQFFLRVDDKFYPDFVKLDRELRAGPSFLYVQLFRLCRDRDRCVVAQAELAANCKCSVRSIQNFLRSLVRFGYVRIEPREDGPNAYVLLLSSRVKKFLDQARVDRSSLSLPSGVPASASPLSPAQHFHKGDENISPFIRDQRDQDPPLTPRTPLRPSRSGGSSSAPGHGSGGSPVRVRSAQTHPDAQQLQVRTDFEKLWDAWPSCSRQNRAGALRIFLALTREGGLPPLPRLLETVKLFSEQDDRWRRGFAPNLVNWLRDRRWEDELRPASGTPGQLQERKEDPAAAELRTKVRAVHERYGSNVFSSGGSDVSLQPNSAAAAATFLPKTASRFPDTVAAATASHLNPALPSPDLESASAWVEEAAAALATLWPGNQKRPALNYLRYLSASGALPDPARLVASAREYLSQTRKPASLINWLRERLGACHAQTPRLCPC